LCRRAVGHRWRHPEIGPDRLRGRQQSGRRRRISPAQGDEGEAGEHVGHPEPIGEGMENVERLLGMRGHAPEVAILQG
jgi:hypothetical protein